ncbi:hypothetical protein ACPA9J_02065 [Pseudomonas aeruginosa]
MELSPPERCFLLARRLRRVRRLRGGTTPAAGVRRTRPASCRRAWPDRFQKACYASGAPVSAGVGHDWK